MDALPPRIPNPTIAPIILSGQEMVMNLSSVCGVCMSIMYVSPKSVCRKDLGYKGYELGKAGDYSVCFVKSEEGPEFVTAAALVKKREWKLDFSVNFLARHRQTGSVEHGHSVHQDCMHTMGSHSQYPAVLWLSEVIC